MATKENISILVTGCNGQLGREFQRLAPKWPQFNFRFATKAELDIRLEKQVNEWIIKEKPHAVFNCAAYTNVERAEEEPDEALLTNARAVKYLAEACREQRALLIHFSTDYVFDGYSKTPYTESDKVNPLNAYGKSKLSGERVIEEAMDRFFILRISWLYSSYGHNFYKTMLRLANENQELRVVNDQIASPTYAGRLAEDTLRLAHKTLVLREHVKYGIYHYAESGEASWFLFAQEIMKQHGLNNPVHPITTGQHPTRATRPAYSKLDSSRFEKMMNTTVPAWQQGLSDCIKHHLQMTNEKNG